MEQFKMCNDGEFMPENLPCPPPYSGPYYYYPYDNIPFPPPAQGSLNSNKSSGGSGGGPPISAGAVAGIIILMALIIIMLCLFAIKFRTRLYGGSLLRLSGSRNPRNRDVEAAGDRHASALNSGDVLFTVVGGGLEEKLVNLLPVYEYVRFQDEGKELLNVQQKVEEEGRSCTECAVCLSLFEEKDIVRILPKCKHVFHLLCIDKWFESHANCPLCRERITLQTIQLFLENSQDHAPHVDGDHQQLEEFNACHNGANHVNNRGADAVDYNCPAAMDACDDQCHHYPVPQRDAEALATCAPRDNNLPIHDIQRSAAGNDDGPQIGYHAATKQYQSDQDEGHGLFKKRFTSDRLQKPYMDSQGFSFPVAAHRADHIEGENELSSEAGGSAPLLIESRHAGVVSASYLHDQMGSYSRKESCSSDQETGTPAGIHACK